MGFDLYVFLLYFTSEYWILEHAAYLDTDVPLYIFYQLSSFSKFKRIWVLLRLMKVQRRMSSGGDTANWHYSFIRTRTSIPRPKLPSNLSQRHTHASQTKLEEEPSTPIGEIATARNATRSQALTAQRKGTAKAMEEEWSQGGSYKSWRKSRVDSKRNAEWLRAVYGPMQLPKENFLSSIPQTTCHSQNIRTTGLR